MLNSERVKEITIQMYNDYVEELQVRETLNLGVALVLVGQHPNYGDLALINTINGNAACLIL